MKTGITKWYGKKVFTLATKANVEAMHTAALLLQKDIKTHFTGGGPGAVAAEKARRAAGGKMRTGGKSPASRPGQPPAIQSGILRASIMTDVTVVGGVNVIGKVGPDVDYIAAKAPTGTDVNYGLYMEIGTVPHTIRVKKAKVLSDGSTFFGKQVSHPGTAPRPFLRPALKRTRRKINQIFRKANS